MKKIGIIDSGIGGLSILSHLLNMSRECSYYYQSDHSNVPYGGRNQAFMFTQVCKMVDKLLLCKVDLVIIACNTLTVETIEHLRQKYSLNFVGVEPYINFVNTDLYNPSEKIGLIVTQATFESLRFNNLRKQLDPDSKVEVVALKNLALIIEKMNSTGIESCLELLETELDSLKSFNFDALILGCTHYPLVSKYIESYLSLRVLDPHVAVCNHVFKSLGLRSSQCAHTNEVSFNYCSEIDSLWDLRKLNDFCFF